MPYISRNVRTIAYPNRFETNGNVSKITVIEKIAENEYIIKVMDRGDDLQFTRISYKKVGTKNIVIEHVFGDLVNKNHRLYEGESVAQRGKDPNMASDTNPGKPGFVKFDDGISLLIKYLERLTGERLNSNYCVVSENTGVKSSFPTLEKIVFGEARRHNKVTRVGTKFASMPTDVAGGAKPLSNKEKMERLQKSAERNLMKAEENFKKGEVEHAEKRFEIAAEYEARSSLLRQKVAERAGLLRERVALAQAKRKAALEAAKRDAG